MDSPINQIEIDFLKNAREHAAKFLLCGEQDRRDFCRRTSRHILTTAKKFIAEIMEVDKVMLFPVSAKTGQGIEELKEAVLTGIERRHGKYS